MTSSNIDRRATLQQQLGSLQMPLFESRQQGGCAAGAFHYGTVVKQKRQHGFVACFRGNLQQCLPFRHLRCIFEISRINGSAMLQQKLDKLQISFGNSILHRGIQNVPYIYSITYFRQDERQILHVAARHRTYDEIPCIQVADFADIDSVHGILQQSETAVCGNHFQ